jgi:mannose-binding lectin 2
LTELKSQTELASSHIFFIPFQHQHPYLSAMVNNGTMKYDHDRDGTHTMVGGCEVKFRNVDYDTFLSIRYENDVLTGKTRYI